MRATLLALAALVALPGCALIDGLSGGGSAPPDGTPHGVGRHVGIFDVQGHRDLDLLIVVDNSSLMVPFQTAFGQALSRFVDGVSEIDGGKPSLHIGVTTSSLGAGPYNIQQCQPPGDDGLVSNNACAVNGAYVSDLDNGDGTRTTNVTGSLDDALSCMVQRGQVGCGFEQHLGAAERALVNTNNGDFVRDGVPLMIMVLGSEDDCTVSDSTLFDPAQAALLGPLASYRCTSWGVDCDTGNSDPQATGPRMGCHSRADSPYLPTAADIAVTLHQAKPDPAGEMFVALVGPPTPFGVDLDAQQHAELQHSCQSANGVADPAVRMTELTDSFPARARTESICNDDLGGSLLHFGELAADVLGRVDGQGQPAYCLIGADDGVLTPNTCWVDQVTDLDGAGEQRTHVPSCDSSPDATCYRFVADATTCDLDDAHARLELDHLPSPVPDARYVVDCPK